MSLVLIKKLALALNELASLTSLWNKLLSRPSSHFQFYVSSDADHTSIVIIVCTIFVA